VSATADDPAISWAMSGGQGTPTASASPDTGSSDDPAIAFAASGGTLEPEGELSPLHVTATRAEPNPMPILDPTRLQGQDPSQIEAARRAVTPTSLDPLVNKAVNYVTGLPGKWGDELQAYARSKGVENPYLQAAIGEVPQLTANVAATFAPFGFASDEENAAREVGELGNYSAREESEISRLADIHARAEAKGFDIPEVASPERLAKSAANNQSVTDNVVRANFGLTKKAPLTPQMLEGWREDFNAANSYAEARNIGKLQLNDDALNGLSNLPKPIYDRLGIDSKISPSGVIDSNDAVDISQALRSRSSQLWRTSKTLPEYEDQAIAMDKTIDSLEDSVTPHMKDPNQWALDRAKNAQSYNVQAALDSGHVDVGDLARMKFAKGQIKPWTGDLSDLADLGQLHPDAFRLNRTPVPRYGALRKGLAWGAGAAAAGAAAKLGMGAVSHVVGSQAANAVAPE